MTINQITACSAIVGMMATPLAAQSADTKMLTAEEASAIALAVQPGTIAEAELDQFEGRAAYDVEVVDQDGQEIEYKIDAESGEILNIWTDDDPTDDPVSAALENVTFLIPGDPGGGWDTVARALGDIFTTAGVAEDLSFENRAGNNGGVGLAHMIENAGALSNTLLLNTTQIVTRSLTGFYSDSYTDLVPIAAPIANFIAFIVHPESDIQTMSDLMQVYENDASIFAIGGGSAPKGIDHLIAAMVIGAADEDPTFRYVQFDAVETAFEALVVGQVAALTTEYTRALALSERGIARVIGVTAPEDYLLPDGISTMLEQDIEVDFTTWTGFFAVPGTTEQEIAGYDAAFTALYQTDIWSEAVDKNGWVEMRADAGQFSKHLEEQHDQIRAVLEKLAEQ